MKKYFTEKQIYIGTFWGGPIATGLLIYKNFKAIGEESKAIMTLIITLIFSSLLFWGILNIPDGIMTKIPDIIFPLVYTAIVYLVYRTYFAKLINPKIEEEGNKASNWLVAGYTLFGLVVSAAVLIWFAYNTSEFEGEIAHFGKANCELYYNPETITQDQVNTLGNLLTLYGYFGDEEQTSAQIQLTDDEYELSLIVLDSYLEDEALLGVLEKLRANISDTFQHKAYIKLIAYDPKGNQNIKLITETN